ncbi:MAG TPA: MFS transporter [Methylomirabilota bacterium]|nr:MFS transporter [Methylomirabilota bacterium]
MARPPMRTPASGDALDGLLFRLLRTIVDIRPPEARALTWSWLYFFSILSAYYVIRPIRDEIGAAEGIEKLPWLFTGTLLTMLLANPPFSALVTRLAPIRFISWTYRFFAANLLVFLILLESTVGAAGLWTGRVFYIWAAVFNLFIVSVFWGFLADVFSSEQSRRLFGFIAAGGTLGGILGSALTSALVQPLGRSRLLLVSAVLLEVAVLSVRRLSRISRGLRDRPGPRDADRAIGGTILAGFAHAVKSLYLLNLSAYMLLFTILSTFLYFQQADLAKQSFTDRAARTAFFANVDLAVNALTLLIQLLLTGRIIKTLGVAVTLALLPALSVAGFALLGLTPLLWAVVIFQVLRRAGNFAVARPTRETCFTVVPREDKYKAKSFIDTFVYRAGDQVGAWSYAGLGLLGLGVGGISLAAVPIALLWVVNALWLGRRNETMARRNAVATSDSVPPVSVVAREVE